MSTQKGSSKPAATKPASSKQAATKAPAKPANKRTAAPQAPQAGAAVQTVQSSANPAAPIVLAGPLARKEVAESLARVANEMGVQLTTDTAGHIITEEQRHGERRHSERAKLEQQATDEANQFAVAQLTTPQAPASEAATMDPEKQKQFLAELERLQQQFGVAVQPVTTFAATPRTGRPVQNGITRPGPDTVTGKVWRFADEITAKNGSPASINELKLHPDLRMVNDHTIRTQYAKWRKFNDISGRVVGVNGQKANSSKAAKIEITWPEMPDSEFMRYEEQERNKELAEGFKPWMAAERSRREALKAQASNDVRPMTDEMFEKFKLLKMNNNLAPEMEKDLAKEIARRQLLDKVTAQ